MQQYFGLNIDGMGRDFSVLHAAVCAASLPVESRIMREINGEESITQTDALLNLLEYEMRTLLWFLGGADKLRKPKPLIGRVGDNEGYAMEVHELDEFLSRTRQEC